MKEHEPTEPENFTEKEGKQLQPLFSLGFMGSTPGALAELERAGQEGAVFLLRHVMGDWGNLDEEDWQQNDLAVEQGDRLLSAYILQTGTKIWIITEADRSATTILLPHEY